VRISDVKILVMGTNWRNLIFVKCTTDEGLVGFGEATIQNREEAVAAYLEAAKKRYILGSDPFNIEDLWLRMFRDDYWRGGVVGATAISAVEMACWDIVGKALGQPVWRLLGGQVRDRVKAYANAWYQTDRDPQEFARLARGVVERGYRALKVDPFGPGFYELAREEKLRSIELVEAVRDAVGPEVELFIEGHGRFSPQTAIELADMLAPFQPGWFEEPVPPDNVQALRYVKSKVRIPVAAGERCFTRFGTRDLIEQDAVDVVQSDVIHAGGILELKKIAAMADSHFMTVAPHNANSPLCTAAVLHFAFSCTNFKIQETMDDFSEPAVQQAVIGRPLVRDGYFDLPTRPGIGVELNEDLIAEHPYREGHFNLFKEGWQRRQFALEQR